MLLRSMLVCLLAISVWSTAVNAGVDVTPPPAPVPPEEVARQHDVLLERKARAGADSLVAGMAAAGALASSASLIVGPIKLDTIGSVESLLQILVTPAVGSLVGAVLGVAAVGILRDDDAILAQGAPMALLFGGGLALATVAIVVGVVAGVLWLSATNPVLGVAALVGLTVATGGYGPYLVYGSPIIAAVAAGGGAILAMHTVWPEDAGTNAE